MPDTPSLTQTASINPVPGNNFCFTKMVSPSPFCLQASCVNEWGVNVWSVSFLCSGPINTQCQWAQIAVFSVIGWQIVPKFPQTLPRKHVSNTKSITVSPKSFHRTGVHIYPFIYSFIHLSTVIPPKLLTSAKSPGEVGSWLKGQLVLCPAGFVGFSADWQSTQHLNFWVERKFFFKGAGSCTFTSCFATYAN